MKRQFVAQGSWAVFARVVRRRLLTTALIAVVGWVAGSAPLARAQQEKFSLRHRDQVGQTWAFERAQSFQMKNVVSANGQVAQTVEQKMQQYQAGTLQVLEATDGKAGAIRVTFDPKCGSTVEQAGQPAQQIPFALAGHTVIIRLQNGQVTTDQKDQFDEQTMTELKNMIEPDEGMLPAQPVGVGDTWKLGRKELQQSFQLTDRDDGAGQFGLNKVKTVNGRKVGELSMGITLAKVEQGFLKLEMDLKGTGELDLETGRMIAGDIEGNIKSSGAQTVPGDNGQQVQLTIAGEGKVTIKTQDKLVSGGTAPVAAGPTNALPTAGPTNALPTHGPAGPDLGGGAPPVTPEIAFSGTYKDERLTLEMTSANGRTTGTLKLGDKQFPCSGQLQGMTLTGKFDAGGGSFDFNASFEGQTLVFTTGTTTYRLKRAVTNPLAP